MLGQKNNAILYLAAAHDINPHDEDVSKLLEHVIKEDPDLKVHVRDPSFDDNEEEFYNYLDDHQLVDDVNHLEELPSELLVEIFDWLKPPSVAKFRQVSKHYRDLLVKNVYWQDKYARRWALPNIEAMKKIHIPIPEEEFYYQFYQVNHSLNVNWLNRATKFEEIKKLKGESDGLYTAPELGIVTIHSCQQNPGQHKRFIEFFRFKRGNLHRIKQLRLEIDVAMPKNIGSMSTYTANHLISYVNDGTIVFTEIDKRESKLHKITSPIKSICGLPTTNGIQFLAGNEKSLTYYDGLEAKKTIEVCKNGLRIASIKAQQDGTTAAILTTNPGNNHVEILDIETESVVETFPVGTDQHMEWMMLMPGVLIGLGRNVTFYDTRTKDKFAVPKAKNSLVDFFGVAMDDVKLFASSRNQLTLFDCRYSSSIVEQVPLPQLHSATPGLALWCSQKLFYASKQDVVEWDMGQIIRPGNK